jgi:hypothetical protein
MSATHIIPDVCKCSTSYKILLISGKIDQISLYAYIVFNIVPDIKYKPSLSGADWWQRQSKLKIRPDTKYIFLLYLRKIFNIGPNIEWQRLVNLNIRPNVKGFFFHIEENYSISKVSDEDIE